MKYFLLTLIAIFSVNISAENSSVENPENQGAKVITKSYDKELIEISNSIEVMSYKQDKVISLIEERTIDKENAKKLEEINGNLKLTLKKMGDTTRFSNINANMLKIIKNTTESQLTYWDHVATIVSSILSFIAIVATVCFGWLTYKLTVKYGESEQEVKDLHLIIDGLQSQREASIETSKPMLKDTEVNITPIEHSHTKFKFSITIKNYGLRPAHKVNYQFIFFKLNSASEIESDGKQTSDKSSLYQAILLPDEESKKTMEGNLMGGLADLKTVIARFEMKYYDDLKNEYSSYFYYYGFKVSGRKVEISDLPEDMKYKIEEYMKK